MISTKRWGESMDRIAIISDIHGNIPALEAVLSDIKNREISRIICLGDLVGKGPDSEIAVDMIKNSCELVIKGNWDYFMTDGHDSEAILWHRKKLGKERLDYLKTLPIYTEFFMSGKLIRLCHAGPEDVFQRVASTASHEEKKMLFKAPNGKNKESDVVGYGDVHFAYIDNFQGKILFNVGSVGNPLEITQACYSIIEGKYESKDNSPFSITLVRVPYDIEKAVQQAIESKMPDLEDYIDELRTARYRGVH
jgi:protein phosphatase